MRFQVVAMVVRHKTLYMKKLGKDYVISQHVDDS